MDEEGITQPRFQVHEWLGEEQIKYLFSKFAGELKNAAKDRQTPKNATIKEPSPVKESDFVIEAQQAEDEDNESHLIAANQAGLLQDIMLEVKGDDQEEKHPLKVCV